MSTPTFPAAPTEREWFAAEAERPAPIESAFAALRADGPEPSVLTRFSDLDRQDAAAFAREWPQLPEVLREETVRAMQRVSDERVDLSFGRALRVALDDPSAVVRQLAVGALWEDDRRDLVSRLQAILADDPSQDVRAEAASGLGRFAEAAAAGALPEADEASLRRQLIAVCGDEGEPYVVRRRALEAVGPFGSDPAIVDLIEDFFASGDQGLQGSALVAMGRSLDRRWLPTLLDELAGSDAELRFEAARACGALGDQDALPALAEVATDEDADVRRGAIAALGRIGGRGAQRLLHELAAEVGDADEAAIGQALAEADATADPLRVGG